MSMPEKCSKHVEDNSVTNILVMNKENCALKLVDEITLQTCILLVGLLLYSTIDCFVTANCSCFHLFFKWEVYHMNGLV